MNLRHRLPRSRGFTLLELLVVVAVVGILAAVGLPSYADMSARHRLAAASQRVAQELQQARYEAVQMQRPMHVAFRTGPGWCWAVSREAGCDCGSTLPACAVRHGDGEPFGGVGLVQAQSLSFDPRLGQAGTTLAATLVLGDRRAEVRLAGSGRARACAVGGELPGLPRCD